MSARPRDLEHCQIVRMDGELKARVEAYRQTLEQATGRGISFAAAVRALCRRALPRQSKKRRADTGQMKLFSEKRQEFGA